MLLRSEVIKRTGVEMKDKGKRYKAKLEHAVLMLEMGMSLDHVYPPGITQDDCLVAAHDLLISFLHDLPPKMSTEVAIAATECNELIGRVRQ